MAPIIFSDSVIEYAYQLLQCLKKEQYSGYTREYTKFKGLINDQNHFIKLKDSPIPLTNWAPNK